MSERLYEGFDTREAFQAALDRLLEQPGRELRIFDPNGEALNLNQPARVRALERFLQGSRTRRIYIVLQDPQHLQRHCPRMMSLLARYSHAIAVHRTHEEIAELRDAFLVVDSSHYVRRPVANFFRGAIGLSDETEAAAMRERFNEIWAASYPAVSATTLGL